MSVLPRLIALLFFIIVILTYSTPASAQNDPPWCSPTLGGSCSSSICPASGPWHPTWEVQCTDAQGPSGSSHYCCEVAPPPPPPAPTLTGWRCSSNSSMVEVYSDGTTRTDCACDNGSTDCAGGSTCRSSTAPWPYTENAECYTPNCDRGESYGACTGAAGTCGSNGTKSCTYTSYSGGTDCHPVACSSQQCSYDNCSSGYTCSNGTCSRCDYNKTFDQCGANANTCANGYADGIAASHTVKVDEYHNSASGAVCKYNCTDNGVIVGQCGNTAANPWTTLSSSCSGTSPTLHAQWGNISGSCNIYVRVGSCDHQISTSCSGDMPGITNLGSCGTVTGNVIYALFGDSQSSDSTTAASCNTSNPYCGDHSCNNGETCSTCPGDCGSCGGGGYCGDRSCNNGETCSTCPGDCGSCGGSCTLVTLTALPSPIILGNQITLRASSAPSGYSDNITGGIGTCPGATSTYAVCNTTATGTFTWRRTWSQNSQSCSSNTASYSITATPVTLKPTISCNPNCTGPTDRFLISWASINPAVTWVDISPTNNFTNNFYNKNITGGKTSTTAPGGFCRNPYNLPCDNTKSPLYFLFQSQTFYVRLFNGAHTQPVDYGLIKNSDCTSCTSIPPTVTGTIGATDCTATAGSSSCNTNITWNTTPATSGPRVCYGAAASGQDTDYLTNGTSSPPGGVNVPIYLPAQDYIFNLYSKGTCNIPAEKIASKTVHISQGSLPPPTNLTDICPVPGTAAHINWTDVPGANFYLLTVNNATPLQRWPPFPNPAGTLPGYKTYFNTAAGNSYNWKLQSCWWTFTGIGYACSGYSAEPTITCGSPLSATCSGTAHGSTVDWVSTASGGSLSYTDYTWLGSDGVVVQAPYDFSYSSSLASTSKIYSTSGPKTAHVTVRASNGQTATSPDCSATTTIYTPWIQVTGDVHSNTGINAIGGP